LRSDGLKILGFSHIYENIRVFSCLSKRHSDERSCNINHFRNSSYGLLTGFPQKLWRTPSVRVILVLFTIFCLTGLAACSNSKGIQKQKEQEVAPVSDAGLITKGETDVKAKLGEPTNISKTSEGHLLYVYRPSWKLLPDDSGTMYVEFVDGKVIRIFKKK